MKLRQSDNSYFINSPIPFHGTTISKSLLAKSIRFSFDMVFGDGHHRNRRSGGNHLRKNGELFCNTIQGKLAEVILHLEFNKIGLNCTEPDFEIMGEGIWDNIDLIVEQKKINVKSCAFFFKSTFIRDKRLEQKR